MKDTDKTKDMLIKELVSLRERLSQLEGDAAAMPMASTEPDTNLPEVRTVLFIFKQLLSEIPVCISRFTHEGVITMSLGSGLLKFGLGPNDLVGFNMVESYPPSREPFQKAMESKSTVMYRSDGIFPNGELWAFQNYMMYDQSNPEGGCINISIDISEQYNSEKKQRDLESQMQQAQKLESLGVLAGGIAHDFNNLLTGILGNAELARMELGEDHEAVEYVDSIGAASERAADLCRQMLAYAGKGRYMVSTLEVNSLIAGSAEFLRASTGKNVKLEIDYHPAPISLKGDPQQINQVLVNLVTNASEAIEEKGTVKISSGYVDINDSDIEKAYLRDGLVPGRYIYFEVADNGVGIEPESIPKIFDPFFTTRFLGRGLGLAAVLGIVRGHRGGLNIDSTPGVGTTIRVFFPEARSEKPSPIRKLNDGARFEGKILIIDDELEVLKVGRSLLQHLGYEVLTAKTGSDGLQIIKEKGSELMLVFLDLSMPDLSGQETFRLLRRMQKDLPVLLCSGYSEQEAASLFNPLDIAGFLQKPFNKQQLQEKLELVLCGEA